jgi:uncharacterized protein (TIGR02453 family)
MTLARNRQFGGFSRDALMLLRELETNNTRAWFAAHRQQFRELLVEPARNLIIELGPLLRERLSSGLRAEPRAGGSILSMDRDLRYDPDQPFRTHVELWFWEGRGPSHQHPGFFVRIASEQLVIGTGMMLFPPDLLMRYRDCVNQAGPGGELVALLGRLKSAGVRINGQSLRRTPRPFADNHQRSSLLRMLGLYAQCVEVLPDMMPEAVLGPELPELLVREFSRFVPLWRWLAALDTMAQAIPNACRPTCRSRKSLSGPA